MTEIYHGSLEIVTEPRIIAPNRPLDYGAGFYATTSQKQATEWVERKLKKGTKGYVNIYQLDETKLTDLNVLRFEGPTEEWLDFVMVNRTHLNYQHPYDIVYGPVANDRVYAAFGLYESGVISKQLLILELKTYKLVDQYLFHTPRSLEAIKNTGIKEVTL